MLVCFVLIIGKENVEYVYCDYVDFVEWLY